MNSSVICNTALIRIWIVGQPFVRCFSVQKTSRQHTPKKNINLQAEPPSNITRDWIGPPDPKSNLRPIKLYIPENETTVEKEYREKRQETQKWNQAFWTRLNEDFVKEKEKYIQTKLKEMGYNDPDASQKTMTTEDMYKFYKQFLDDNYQVHMLYNKEWYRRNISLLWPALKVSIHRLFIGR